MTATSPWPEPSHPGGPTPVELAGQPVALDQLRRNPQRYRSLFDDARTTPGWALCRCTDPPQRLVIRARSARFFLACWPHLGDQHATTCEFYRCSSLSGRAGYTESALSEGPDGVRIRLRTPMELRTTTRAAAAPVTAPAAPREPGHARRTMGLLGLLHYLWEHSDLHTHRPDPRGVGGGGERSWANCWAELTDGIAQTSVNDRDLHQLLYVVPPFTPATAEGNAAAYTRFLHGLGRHGRSERRGLVLGEIKTIGPSAHGQKISLAHLRRPLFLTDQLLGKLHVSYRPAFSDRRPPGARTIGLLLITRTAKMNVTVVDAAVMLTNRAFIPADSSHEVVMADHLLAGRRSFTKPLRYDGSDAVFPDFVLLDTDPPTPVEVWGITGREDYELRKRQKKTHYQQAGSPTLVEWDVNGSLPQMR